MNNNGNFEKIKGKIHYSYIIYPESLFVYNLYVEPKYRGRHLPRLLFQALMNKWHTDIMLECEESLCQYYAKMGFQMIENKDKNNRYLIELKNMEEFKKRMCKEYVELKDRLTKLDEALSKDGFKEKVGDIQWKLMREQSVGMHMYLKALEGRMKDLKIDARKIPTVTFGKVIEAMKVGECAYRESWKDKNVFVLKQIPAHIREDVIPNMQSLPQAAKNIILKRETPHIDYTDQMLIIYPDGRADAWFPTPSDIFAEDWVIIA